MEPAELEGDVDLSPPHGRAQRAIAVISTSLIAIMLAGIGFLRPALPSFGTSAGAARQAAYHVVAAEFVDRNVGWVTVLFPSGDYAILRTTDGARTWTSQLTVQGNTHPTFMRFFDRSTGVFALLGTSPLLRRTTDGGKTWSVLPALDSTSAVDSWSFVDSTHGWMLAESPSREARLYRSQDGGRSWDDLGAPVRAGDSAYQVHFASRTTGWLTASVTGAYAYRTGDSGATWSRVDLPAPTGGWPATGAYFVAVQPTAGRGAFASVVFFPPIKGRTGIGANIRAYPPLTVRSFDGGRPHIHLYATGIDQIVSGPWTQEQAPNQVELSTIDNGAHWNVIAPPSTVGAIGFVDATNWWWIGAGALSKSRDSGVTWSSPREAGVVDPQPGTVRVLDRAHAWFAGSGDSRPVLEATDDGAVSWRAFALPALDDSPTP